MHAQHGGERLLVDHALGEQYLAERPVLTALRGQRGLQLLGGQHTVFQKEVTEPLLLAKSEAALGLAFDRAHATSRTGASSWRRISCSTSGVKRRWRPGVRNAGWIAPRFTARISVDLLIPSQRAASLVESAGFMTSSTGANASTGSNLRRLRAGRRPMPPAGGALRGAGRARRRRRNRPGRPGSARSGCAPSCSCHPWRWSPARFATGASCLP